MIYTYRMHARARVMSEIEEVQEQMKADMEAMKEKMATMMEAMMSMKKIMEINATTAVDASIATEVDPTHPSGLNQVNPLVSDIVGQGGEALGSTDDPYFVQVQNKHSFPQYGLPPNYTLPNVAPLPMRMSTTPLPYSLRANNPNLIMHMSLNPWGRHMRHPETII